MCVPTSCNFDKHGLILIILDKNKCKKILSVPFSGHGVFVCTYVFLYIRTPNPVQIVHDILNVK